MSIERTGRPTRITATARPQAAASRPARCFGCGTPLAHVYSTATRLERCPGCGMPAR